MEIQGITDEEVFQPEIVENIEIQELTDCGEIQVQEETVEDIEIRQITDSWEVRLQEETVRKIKVQDNISDQDMIQPGTAEEIDIHEVAAEDVRIQQELAEETEETEETRTQQEPEYATTSEIWEEEIKKCFSI